MTADPFQADLARAGRELREGRRGEAERVYRDILARHPDHPVAAHYLGVTLVQDGRVEAGLELLRRSMAHLQGDAGYRHNYALMLAQAGRLAEAERELEAAVALAPAAMASHHYLAIVRQQQGRLADAGAAYRAALALAPAEPSLAANYGFCLLEQGDAAGAVEWLRRATAGAPNNAVAHNNLCCALRAVGAAAESVASARRAVAIDPHYAAGWYNLGLALRDAGDAAGAFDALCRAVREGPDFATGWQAFADEFARARFTRWDPGAAAEVTRALQHPAVDPGPLAAAAASLLMLDPAFAPVASRLVAARSPAAASANAGAAEPDWFEGEVLQRLAHPMLLALIEHAVVPDIEFEAMLTVLRARAALAWDAGRLIPSPLLIEVLAVLAQQCFLNEYIWEETAQETRIIERLAARLAASAPLSLDGRVTMEWMLLGAYRPLFRYAADSYPPLQGAAARVWQRQVEEPAAERAIRDTIPVLTAIADDISSAVRDQYEENPYPRWLRLPGSFSTPFPLRRAMRSLFPLADLSRMRIGDVPEILLAGCGTGFQAAIAGARNPGARITAVDLSRTSLAFAMRRCAELGLKDIRFGQADILELAQWTQRFDCVECSGVLHHMRDPLAGWSILASLVKPGGVMQVALYSEVARQGVVAARRLLAGQLKSTTLQDIRDARKTIAAQAEGSPTRQLVHSPDFYSASGVRDLVLHVEEHRFTLTEIEAALRRLGLQFLGFELQDPNTAVDYRQRFADDPAACSLQHWEAFERERPNIFAGMYQFWVLKPFGEAAE